MKKIYILLLSTLCASVFAQSEFSLPETPKKIEFANVIVNLDDDTRKVVDRYLVSLLTPQNAYLDSKLELMQWYFPFIEKILEQENVPDDLKYLAVQESGLKPDALSSSAAVGFWQFKEATGKELGLRIDNEVDERRYIFASTTAAANYFKKNNIVFKNWISCIYAYYQGPTGAAKDIPNNWSYASEVDFNKETPDYLLKALAHRIAYEHRLNRLKQSANVLINYPVTNKSLAEIAIELTVDLSELRKYNAWFFSASSPADKTYQILIPVNRSREQEIRDKIGNTRTLAVTDQGYPVLKRQTMVTTSDDDPVFYEINTKKGILAQPGLEASQLSKKADISLTYFLKFNDLTDKDIIKPGLVYYLEPKAKKGPVKFHTADKNQTFWDVSQMYGVKLKKLLKFNRLKNIESLQPGRVVWLQKKRPKSTPVEIIKLQEEVEKEIPVMVTYEPKIETPKPSYTTPTKTEVVVETPKKPIVINKIEPKKEETVVVSPKPVRSSSSVKTHTVVQGETFYAISRKYNIPVKELMAMNGMKTSDVLQYGQVINVSRDTNTPAIQENPRTTTVREEPRRVVSNGANTHIVEKGETLYSISKMYNTSVSQLQKWNNMNDYTISIGSSLIVGEGANSNRPSSSSTSTHTVSSGQTLYSISKMYNVSVPELKTWNRLSDNTISIGQVLRVK
jgi:membrane-bound lytic murein transglycosylase D